MRRCTLSETRALDAAWDPVRCEFGVPILGQLVLEAERVLDGTYDALEVERAA